MKIPLRGFLFAGLAVLPAALPLSSAQTRSVPPADVPLRPVVPGAPAQPAAPAYALPLKWDDRGGAAILTVPFRNDSDQPLQVLGVQATRGIFVGDYPDKIGPKKEDRISFFYAAADNTDGDTEVIRLLTDRGIKEVVVRLAREQAVQFDTRELHWTAGGAAETKAVTLTVAPGTAAPLRARATGGHQAELQAVNATSWSLKITPASTAKSGKFAVFVEFDRALPGMAPVVLGVIQPRD